MSGLDRLANDAWEAYYRAQATIARELSDSDTWAGVQTTEYAVLHALSTEPDGLRISDLRDDVLLTQPGISRLIARLEDRGLVERTEDADDARARRIRLTSEGLRVQRQVGRVLVARIAEVMNRALTAAQLESLRDVSVALLAGTPGPVAQLQRDKLERNRS